MCSYPEPILIVKYSVMEYRYFTDVTTIKIYKLISPICH